MSPTSPQHPTAYQTAGVDTEQADIGLKRLAKKVQQTWTSAVKLPLGYFANVIDLGGTGLAISTDGVGTKALVAQMMGKYDTIGIDCVAMNVNDVLCVGATPISMVDYIALQEPHPDFLEAIGEGLYEGARRANISICGGEIAQLRDIVKSHREREGYGFDVAGTAFGTVSLDKIIIGQDIQEGDAVIGIESNGIHSNGLTLARHVFFERHHYSMDALFPTLRCTLGEELLKPTHIYVQEVLEILQHGLPVKALIHITSDGLLNLTRVEAEVGYIIEYLPEDLPIFSLIQQLGEVDDTEMFRVFNMGIGFCIAVRADEAERVLSIVRAHGKQAYKIGHAERDKNRRVSIPSKGIYGEGKRFFKAK
jgi:phosphoribosylformylglycinamidine cyclo-ligase